MRLPIALVLLLFLSCTTRTPEREKLLAAPDQSQPAVAIVGPHAPQQIRPPHVLLAPSVPAAPPVPRHPNADLVRAPSLAPATKRSPPERLGARRITVGAVGFAGGVAR